MRILIPFFPDKAINFWWTSKGISRIRDILTQAKAVNGVSEVIVLGENAMDLTPFSQLAEIKLVSRHADILPGIFPPDTISALAYASAEKALSKSDLMVINFRNIGLTKSCLKRAMLEYYASGKSACLSVKLSRNHLCQLQSYEKLVGVTCVHCLEDVSASDSCNEIGSQSFPFDWTAVDEFIPDATVCVQEETRTSAIQSLLGSESNRLQQINSRLAKAMFDKENLKQITESLWGTNLVGINTLLRQGASDGNYIFEVEGLPSGPGTLFALPFNNYRAIPQEAFEVYSKDSSQFRVYRDLNGYAGLFCLFSIPAYNSMYTIQERFPPVPDLWRLDKGNLINAANDKIIHGRQNFPKLYEPNDSILACRSIRHEDLAEEYLAGRIGKILLSQSECRTIHKDLDLLINGLDSRKTPENTHTPTDLSNQTSSGKLTSRQQSFDYQYGTKHGKLRENLFFEFLLGCLLAGAKSTPGKYPHTRRIDLLKKTLHLLQAA